MISQLPNPLIAHDGENLPYGPMDMDEDGNSARTATCLEELWEELGIDVNETRIFFCELNPVCSATDVVHSDQPLWDDVCADSMACALSLGTSAIVAFGAANRARWFKADELVEGITEFIQETSCVSFRYHGRDVCVFLGSHPSAWSVYSRSSCGQAMASAHNYVTGRAMAMVDMTHGANEPGIRSVPIHSIHKHVTDKKAAKAEDAAERAQQEAEEAKAQAEEAAATAAEVPAGKYRCGCGSVITNKTDNRKIHKTSGKHVAWQKAQDKEAKGQAAQASEATGSSSVAAIEPFRFVEIEVDGNHRFQLANGTITHNCATGELYNPIKQDTQHGKLRYYKHGDMVRRKCNENLPYFEICSVDAGANLLSSLFSSLISPPDVQLRFLPSNLGRSGRGPSGHRHAG